MANLPIHSVGEAADAVSKGTLLIAGKNAAGVIGGAAAGVTVGGLNVATLATLGLTATVSASIVQIEHNNKIKHIANFYKEELAAKLGKKANQIGEKDLNTIAIGSRLGGMEDNPIIAEELKASRKRRNLGVVLSAVASIATYVLLNTAIPDLPEGAATGIMGFISKGIIGLATYFAVKAPLHWIGDKLFGVDKQTTHEKIEEIMRDREAGKTISKEQVFDIFVAANPDLQGVIQAKYGKAYEALDLQDKKELTQNLGKLLQIDEITAAINGGNINVSELAFVAVGQDSGVPMKDGTQREKPHGFLSAIKEKWHNIVDHFTHKPHEVAMAVGDENSAARSFAERVGKRTSAELTHIERVEQSRAENPLQQR
jgi:hypothetical protein